MENSIYAVYLNKLIQVKYYMVVVIWSDTYYPYNSISDFIFSLC